MMTRQEMLLTILAEECAEVAQRVSKALRFGLNEKRNLFEQNNAELIVHELSDLETIWDMLFEEGVLPNNCNYSQLEKRERVEKYLSYSEKCGTLISR